MDERVSGHAAERAAGRIAEAGIDPKVILYRAAKIAASYPNTDIAVLMVTLPEAKGDTASDLYSRQSNGNEVWAILRGGRVVTLMLRRADQPHTAAAMRVQRVARIA